MRGSPHSCHAWCAVIALEAVSKRYEPESSLALDDVSFAVSPGELLALIGKSGSGKSTTLKLINRTLEPSSGRVLVAGQDIARLDPVTYRRRIGYVIQGGAL